MSLKELVIIRIGHHSCERLTELGREQMRTLAQHIRPIVLRNCGEQPDWGVSGMTSTAMCAVESAAIIAEACGLRRFDERDFLWSDGAHEQQNERVLKLIRMDAGQTALLVVTHYEYAIDLPVLYGVHALGVIFPRIPLDFGMARVINCETKSHMIRP